MGSSQRDKGKRGERELARVLRDHGYAGRRGQQYSGTTGEADVVGLPHVHIECKRVENLRLWPSLEQARSDARDDELPVVMHRPNRREWVVVQPLEDWLKLYGAYLEYKTLEDD